MSPIAPRPPGCAVPLTPDQRHMLTWRVPFDPQERPPGSRICASAVRITGPLSVGRLEGSIAGLVRRHEALRTTFKTFEGVTTQHIHPPDDGYRLTCVDLSALPQNKAGDEAARLAAEFQDQAVGLSVGPLFEARLFKIASREHILIALVDHMISDEASNALLEKQIWQAYDDGEGDIPASLPAPPLQFADYAVWRERTKESRRAAHEDYWKQHRPGGGPTIIPVVSETEKCFSIGTVSHVALGAPLTAQLRQLAERQRVLLSNVTLMIYATAMSLWCDKEDLIVRCPVHGRHGIHELRNVIGFFSSYLYLRIKVGRQDSPHGLLAQVQEEMRAALAHQDFDRMLELMPECEETELEFHWRSARFRRGLVQKRPGSDRTISRQPFLIRAPKWTPSFWCIFNEAPSDICVTVCYRSHLLRPNAVERFGSDMRLIARALIERPLDPIDQAVLSAGREVYGTSS